MKSQVIKTNYFETTFLLAVFLPQEWDDTFGCWINI